MPQISVTIDDTVYRMACEEGQEDHLTSLAEQFESYVQGLKGQFGKIGDQRITVMAAIMVMDELSETKRKLEEAETEISSLSRFREDAAADAESSEVKIARALSGVVGQIEDVTAKLSARPKAS